MERITRVGLVQNKIVLPTTAPVEDQRNALWKRCCEMIDAAGAARVQVLCLQEAWTMPFGFCTREKYPWVGLALFTALFCSQNALFCRPVAAVTLCHYLLVVSM